MMKGRQGRGIGRTHIGSSPVAGVSKAVFETPPSPHSIEKQTQQVVYNQ